MTRTDYASHLVAAARSVMIELTRLLSEYSQHIVLVGGWVPELLLSRNSIQHIGSIDVDLALNHRTLTEPGYEAIHKLLISRDYRQDEEQPFIYYKTVILNGKDISVEVDLLAGEYAGTGKSHRTQKILDIKARKARGCDLAFKISKEVTVEGSLPSGGKDSVNVKVAEIIPFLIMKGMALADRLKEKDAWDIYFCIKNYEGGLDALVHDFQPHVKSELVQEGLNKIAGKFQSPHPPVP